MDTTFKRGRAVAPAVISQLAFASLLAFAPLALAGAPTPLRIKNGQSITVGLGKAREAATGIRPEKKVWTLELDAALLGAEADLRDVTPNVVGSRWNLPVATTRLVLDAERFLPDHVYRLDLRRERQHLGSVLVYLYPPPAERVTRVNLEEEHEPPSEGPVPATVPKGRL